MNTTVAAKKNMKLLHHIYENAAMGVDSIEQILPLAEGRFARLLSAQLTEYRRYLSEAERLMIEAGEKPDGIPAAARFSANMMTRMKTINGASEGKLAEMMTEGTNAGIMTITRELRREPDAEREITSLASALMKAEKENIEQLKRFL